MSLDHTFYRHFLDAAGDFVALLTPDGRLLHVSESGQQLLGADAAQLQQLTLLDLIPPQQHAIFEDHALPAARQGDRWRGVVTLAWNGLKAVTQLTLTGYGDVAEEPSLLCAIAVNVTPDGRIAGSVRKSDIHSVQSNDISQRKRVAPALRAPQDMLQTVIDTIPQAVFWKNRALEYVGCNRRFADMVGLDVPEDVIGKCDADLPWMREQRKHFEAHDRHVLETNQPELHIVDTRRRADGKSAWLHISRAPLHAADGSVVGVLGTLEDITERRQLEEQTRVQLAATQELSAARTEADLFDSLMTHGHLQPDTAVFLMLYQPHDQTFILARQTLGESGIRPLPAATSLEQQKFSRVLSRTTPFMTADMSTADRAGPTAKRLANVMGARSWSAFPIVSGDTWFGHLLICAKEAAPLDANVVSTYRFLTEQSAVALRAIRLANKTEQSLEQRTRAVSLATRVAQDIAAAADLDELYRQIVTQVHELFGYYHTQLLRYDPGLDTVALVRGYGTVGEEMLALHHSIPMGVGIIGVAALTGQSVLRANLVHDQDWQPNPLLPRTKGELAVPIKLRDEVLGVLDVQSDQADALTEEDQLVLEGLCGQIAVAIEGTRLRQDMEASLRELNTLQRLMSREGWEEYRASRAHVPGYLFDQAGVQVLDPAADGIPKQGRLLSETMKGRLRQTPLSVRGEAIGVMAIEEPLEAPLDPEDASFLESVAQQVAEALEVARLVEQTQDALTEQERLTAQLETVAQVSMAASTTLEVDVLLQTVVDLTKTSFQLYHAAVYLVDDQMSDRLRLKAGAGNVGRLLSLEGNTIHLHANVPVAKTARTLESSIENDVRRIVDFLPHPLLPNTRSEMAVPLSVGNKLVGVLDLHSDKVGYFTDDDVTIQRTLASQVAIAIENAKLYADQVETTVKLRQVDQLKSEFLASMSHELRTPLNSIIGFADVLLEGLDGELNERMEEDVRLIRDSGTHLRSLIGDILDMSKIEAGRMELRYEMVDMRRMAQDIISTAQPLAQEKNLALNLDVADDVGEIEVDRTRLRQVLWNIMGNAIKFTERGSVTLKMTTEDTYLLIRVRDTGIGIRDEDIDVVFEQFRQVDGNLNRLAGGTGLGMPITRRLVELHGGRIWVESVVGEGSTFAFTVPLQRPGKPATGPLAAPDGQREVT